MDIPWVTIASKSNAIRLRRQMEPIATLELQRQHVRRSIRLQARVLSRSQTTVGVRESKRRRFARHIVRPPHSLQVCMSIGSWVRKAI
jgi:hypothetical protein